MALIKSISGIRGTIGGNTGDNLTPLDVVKFTAAYGTLILENHDAKKVVIGRDARPSGKMISDIVCSTLTSMGIDVLDLGLSTTPTVEVAVPMEQASGGIIITASHNPVQWNALKLLNDKGEFISDDLGKRLLAIADAEEFTFETVDKLGQVEESDAFIQKHIDQILALDMVDVEAIKAKDFRVIIDCVNSSGGIALPPLLEQLGVTKVEKLFCEPNGQFPHNPEPLPENLTDLCEEMKMGSYDLGIVVDPDVDRLAFVCEDGSLFGEEYTLVAVADYVLQNKPTPTVSNLSSTKALRDITEAAGQKYYASAVGEVNVVTKMKERGALIGGEGNGGIILPELHYGRDALVGIALFLTYLAKEGKKVSEIRASYPSYQISKNKIELTPEIDVDLVLEEMVKRYDKQPINTIDGVKIEFDNEWVHLRKSNTEPIIRIYSESADMAKANELAGKIMADIREIISVGA